MSTGQVPSADEGEAVRRRREETEFYRDVTVVHDLPPIHHYWAEHYVAPKLAACGYADPVDFFASEIRRVCGRSPGQVEIASLGAGNCDLEVSLGLALLAAEVGNFRFHCLELNPSMVERGRELVERHRLTAHFEIEVADLGTWIAQRRYEVILAHHSLHHVLELERLFAVVRKALGPDGIFLVHDMIGRNGHMRWPEALVVVRRIWRQLPRRYKYNHQLGRVEDEFDNFDCSRRGNEGIRSQDILPLLMRDFHFQVFIGFGNVIDVFIDRSFGPNFDPENPVDRALIDEIAAIDERGLERGYLKPTHMVALLCTSEPETLRCFRHLTPDFCMRMAAGMPM